MWEWLHVDGMLEDVGYVLHTPPTMWPLVGQVFTSLTLTLGIKDNNY